MAAVGGLKAEMEMDGGQQWQHGHRTGSGTFNPSRSPITSSRSSHGNGRHVEHVTSSCYGLPSPQSEALLCADLHMHIKHPTSRVCVRVCVCVRCFF